jgi:hypothetical protein
MSDILSSPEHGLQLRDWVIALRATGVVLSTVALILVVYLLRSRDELAEGVSQRRIELNELRIRIDLLERQMAADPSRTGGVKP